VLSKRRQHRMGSLGRVMWQRGFLQPQADDAFAGQAAGANGIGHNTFAGGEGKQRRADQAAKLLQTSDEIGGRVLRFIVARRRGIAQIRVRLFILLRQGLCAAAGTNSRRCQAACHENAGRQNGQQAPQKRLPFLGPGDDGLDGDGKEV
jgi:hypothetical protein